MGHLEHSGLAAAVTSRGPRHGISKKPRGVACGNALFTRRTVVGRQGKAKDGSTDSPEKTQRKSRFAQPQT